jgi:hydrogenase maturation protease
MKSAADRIAPAAQATVVIGYGNPLRADDGVGPAIAAGLADTFRGDAAFAAVVGHQLLPELAEALRGARRVIFVDASVAVPPGRVAVRRVRGRQATAAALGHAVHPETIVALAEGLYGAAPAAWAVGVGVQDLSTAEGLSPPVSRTAERLRRRLERRIRQWAARPAGPVPTEDSHGSA